MTEIETGVLIDDWKNVVAGIIGIDKSRINYISLEGAGLVVYFTITPSDTDNVTDLCKLFNAKYDEISEIYPYVYDIQSI